VQVEAQSLNVVEGFGVGDYNNELASTNLSDLFDDADWEMPVGQGAEIEIDPDLAAAIRASQHQPADCFPEVPQGGAAFSATQEGVPLVAGTQGASEAGQQQHDELSRALLASQQELDLIIAYMSIYGNNH